MNIGRLLGIAGIIAALSSPALAMTYDAVVGFSNVQNPNGVWSYRQGVTGEPLITSSGTTSGSQALPDWGQTSNGFPDQAWVVGNNTGTDATNSCCTSIVYHAHTLSLDGQAVGAIVRFTAPTTDAYTISALFESNDINMATHNVGIIENGTTALLAATSLVNGNTVTLSPTVVSLNANDYVDFISYGFGGGSYGNTGLQASLTTASSTAPNIPEPAPLAVFATGLLGLGMAGRRSRPDRTDRSTGM